MKIYILPWDQNTEVFLKLYHFSFPSIPTNVVHQPSQGDTKQDSMNFHVIITFVMTALPVQQEIKLISYSRTGSAILYSPYYSNPITPLTKL